MKLRSIVSNGADMEHKDGLIKLVDDTIPESTPMRDYFRGKSIFLTGGTGFLGQLFVEKLLRTEVKEIYVLARPKKGKSSIERLTTVYDGPVFEKLAKIDPEYMHRIKVVEGNMLELGIGISEQDRYEIIENVQIVLHSAADVKFDETLQQLLLVNLRGTREILKLAEQIKKLEAMLHISTAYSHCPRNHIEEKFYEPPSDPDYMIKLAERLQDEQSKETMEIVTERIIAPWPNTYTYTKALTEELVRRYGEKIPVAIIRPSIVIATYEDPIPGWINNIYGLTGVLVSTGLGFQRILPYKRNLIGDIVCADFVINSTLAVAWATYEDHKNMVEKPEDRPPPKIYQLTSYKDRPVTYGEIATRIKNAFYENPSQNLLWLPTVNVTDYAIMEFVYMVLYHIVPAIIFDTFFKITGSKIRLMPMYRKVQKFMKASTYFMTREWSFDNDVMKSVYARMTKADQIFFPSDLRIYNFKDYVHTYYKGMRTYIVKETDFNVEKAKSKLRKLQAAHAVILLFYYSGFLYFYYCVFKWLGLIEYLNCLKDIIVFE